MLKIETLSRDHDRSGFDCGNDALNPQTPQLAHNWLAVERSGIARPS